MLFYNYIADADRIRPSNSVKATEYTYTSLIFIKTWFISSMTSYRIYT